MKKYDIVVARYKEDVSWLSQLDDTKYNLVIYNKGPEDLTLSFIKSENIGGDAETYTRYIVDHYSTLPEFCIFVQGYPFDHMDKIIEKIEDHSSEPFVWLADHVVEESIHGWYEHLIQNSRPEAANHPIMYLDQTAKEILKSECPDKVRFGAGQQFIISRDLILQRSLEFYQDILSRFPANFILPWHMERIWGNVFKI